MADIKIDTNQNAIIINEFDEPSVKTFREQFQKLYDDDMVPIIPIYIDSYGGGVYSLLALIDIIEGFSCRKPIATIALGKAMSCGGLLLAVGSPGYRFAGPNSTIMIHQVSSMSWGTLSEMKNNLKEVERLNNLLFKKLDDRCKKKAGYWSALLKKNDHTDLFLTANQSKKHGLIDQVGLPQFEQKQVVRILL